MTRHALLAEFIGTFMIVFVGVGALASAHAVSATHPALIEGLAVGLAAAAATGATLGISGGHLNPAITIAMGLGRVIEFHVVVAYVLVQCAASIGAALLAQFCFPAEILSMIASGAPTVAPSLTSTSAIILESALSFFLVFVFFCATMNERNLKLGGLYIGFAYGFGTLIAAPFTGGSMNPARHLGPAMFGGGLSTEWIYWGSALLGAGIATLAYCKGIEDEPLVYRLDI